MNTVIQSHEINESLNTGFLKPKCFFHYYQKFTLRYSYIIIVLKNFCYKSYHIIVPRVVLVRWSVGIFHY